MSLVFQSKDGMITGSIAYEEGEPLPYKLSFNARTDGQRYQFSPVSRYANDRAAMFFMKNRAGHDVITKGKIE